MIGPIQKTEFLPIQSAADVILVRQRVRVWSEEMNFSLVEKTKIVTAASELARNALEHGGGGQLEIEQVSSGMRQGIRLAFSDNGPGIANVNLALTDGYASGRGMGLGLGGSKRLMDEFSIDTQIGRGTKVTCIRWK